MKFFDKVLEFLRRPQVWGFFVSVAVMAVVSLAFFYPDAMQGHSLQQADMLQGMANGHEGLEYQQATGEKALWTNALFGGMPTFQISPSYPSNSLFSWLNKVYGLGLPSPSNLLFMMMLGFLILLLVMGMPWYYALLGAVAWGLSSYFVIIIGAGHIWKFLALSYIPPTIAGLVLCYRGRYTAGSALVGLFAMLQLNANHPQMSYYFVLVMAAMVIGWLVEAIRTKRMRRWLTATAVVLGAGMLAVGANLPSLYNTYEYAKETKRSQSELTPIAEAGATTAKERPTGGLSKEDIIRWSYGPAETFSLLIPDIKGGASARPEAGRLSPVSLSEVNGAEAYDNTATGVLLQYLAPYFGGAEGTNGPVYVGAIVVALFLLGCIVVKGPIKWALVVMTILSVLLAWGYNMEWFSDLWIYHFPMYSKFRAVESILVVAEFTMPLLGVMGLYTLFTDKTLTDKQKTTAVLWSFGVPAVLCLAALALPGIYGSAIGEGDTYRHLQLQKQLQDMAAGYGMSPQEAAATLYQYSLTNPDNVKIIEGLRHGLVRADGLRSLCFVLFGFFVVWMALKNKLKGMWAVLLLGAAVLVDLYTVDKRYVSSSSFTDKEMTAVLAPDDIDRAIMADTTKHYRVMDATPEFWDYRRSYFHKMLGGYHAAKLNRYEDLIQRRLNPAIQVGYFPELRNDSIYQQYGPEDHAMLDDLRASYRMLDMLNARYIITGDRDYPVVGNPYALGNAWLVDTVAYVDGADAEMAALATIEPRRMAVADSRFAGVLGRDFAVPAPGDTISLVSYTPNRMVYHADTRQGGIAVFSEVWFPWGWHADIDGQPADLARVNYVLRAMRLPAGEHTVTMTFDPQSLHTTGALAYASVTLIYLLCALALFVACRRESSNKPDGRQG